MFRFGPEDPAVSSPDGREVIRGAALLAELEAMDAAGRLRAYREGRFDRHQRALWAAHYSEEVPTVNGEFEWIARRLADLD